MRPGHSIFQEKFAGLNEELNLSCLVFKLSDKQEAGLGRQSNNIITVVVEIGKIAFVILRKDAGTKCIGENFNISQFERENGITSL